LELASIGTSKNSAVVYFLRMASDFRDNYVSKSTLGLAFIRFYNEHEVKPAQVLALAFGLMLICLFASYRLLGFLTRRHTGLRAVQYMDR
jgi:hypothetical protein